MDSLRAIRTVSPRVNRVLTVTVRLNPHAVVVDTREIELVRRQTVLINMKISVISLRMDFDLQRDYVL